MLSHTGVEISIFYDSVPVTKRTICSLVSEKYQYQVDVFRMSVHIHKISLFVFLKEFKNTHSPAPRLKLPAGGGRSFISKRDKDNVSTESNSIQSSNKMIRKTSANQYFWSSNWSVSCRCRCYLLDGISKGAWLNRSSIIFAGNDKWSVDPRVSIVSSVGDKHEYSLQIQKVDVTDDGQYTCSIQSERNPRPKLLNLIVKGAYTSSLLFFAGTYPWVICPISIKKMSDIWFAKLHC